MMELRNQSIGAKQLPSQFLELGAMLAHKPIQAIGDSNVMLAHKQTSKNLLTLNQNLTLIQNLIRNLNPIPNINSKSNSELDSKNFITKSYNISSLNIPPEDLLRCKFHIDGQAVVLLIDTSATISDINKDKI